MKDLFPYMKTEDNEGGDRTIYLLSLAAILILVLTDKICARFLPGYVIPGSENLLIKIYMSIITVIAAVLVACKKITFSFSCFKVSKECNFKRRLLETVIVLILYASVLAGYRLYKNTVDPVTAAKPFFALYLDQRFRWFYPVSALWQELLIKPLWQDNVSRAMNSKWKTLIFIGLFFCILHMHFPIYYMAAAGVLCFVTGILYESDRNIWCVWLLHFVMGFLPRAFGL
ncbi:MAG: CPBP family intramembrane metalloprotease [Lachnospiraceae bacterium]|nr:CPBP family intramembrane metalloprotease [Lachnospiraceae bacterium]